MHELIFFVGLLYTTLVTRKTNGMMGACVALYFASALYSLSQGNPFLELGVQHSVLWVSGFLALGLFVKEELLLAGAILAAAYSLHNPSMLGCFVVCLLPLLKPDRIDAVLIWLALPVALILAKASLPLALYGVALILQIPPRFWWVLIPPGVMGVAVALAHQPLEVWLSGSGRFELWANALQNWPIKGWLGSGPGSAMLLAPSVSPSPNASAWKDMHNDWLQPVLEYGPLALPVFLGGLASTLGRAADNPVALRQLVLYSAYMVANPPLRSAAGAGLGVYILKKAWSVK